MRGWERASGLMQTRIRQAGETRGFAVSRLLTHWAEIVGEDLARMALPVKVGYAQGGFGATLSVLVRGADAPLVEMQKERIRERVNACYGYAAISRVRVTQTAPTGFAEGQVAFETRKAPASPAPDPEVTETARAAVAPVRDEGLRAALEALGQNVLSRSKAKERQST
ncbi:DUF721 domain-containing protein [Rhodobacteraceae bacterium ASV31]|nr:DUF721 domain-containing protein [Anianabacter salinae]